MTAPHDITFRPITEEDLPFLRELYASTRREEMAPSGWPKDQIENFLTQQFRAQHKHYMEHFQGASFEILMLKAEAIGRLYLEERDREFRVIDIALLPAWRGKGIGGKLMHDIIARAFKANKAVSIHVEQHNPAMHLYQRLGFKKIDDHGVYHLMEITPEAAARNSSSEPASVN